MVNIVNKLNDIEFIQLKTAKMVIKQFYPYLGFKKQQQQKKGSLQFQQEEKAEKYTKSSF